MNNQHPRPDYHSLSDSDLDKMAAEMTDIFVEEAPNDYREKVSYPYITISCGMPYIRHSFHSDHWKKDRWNPTHPDNNQAERYLFPKLQSKHKCIFETRTYSPNRYQIEIGSYSIATTDPDQINRTKVIAALEAWRKINDH